MNLRKIIYGRRTFTGEPPPHPSPHLSQYTFSWTTSPHSQRTYFIDDPLAHLAHSFQSFENYEKNFQLVFYLRVFTIIVIVASR